jgi:hypothetical protein
MSKDLTIVGDIWDPTRHQTTAVKDKPWRPLPLTPEEVTPAWLTTALSSRYPGVKVTSAKITKEKHGFTSLLFMTIEINEAGRKAGIPNQIVVKGGFSTHARHYAHSYAMEAHAQRDVWPHLPLNMPKVYFVELELARGQTVFIMEDLTLRGVKFGHGLQPIGYDMMAKRLTALAELHAMTWDSPEFKKGGKFYGLLSNGARMIRQHMDESGFIRVTGKGFEQYPPFFTPEGWETLWDEKMSQNAAVSHHFRDREWNRKALLHVEHLGDTLPNCVLHMDLHLGNHFEEKDGRPGFIDSQTFRDPCYFDLAYGITCSLDPVDRKNWERGLVGHYVAELGKHGVKLDFDETMYYYALFLHRGLVTFYINDPVWQTPAFNTVNVWRFCAAMMDNGTKEKFDAIFAKAK